MVDAKTNTEALAARVIESLPERVQLVYVSQGEGFSDEQVRDLLAGDTDKVAESLWEWESEHEDYTIRSYVTDVLDDEEAQDLYESDDYESVREVCWERADSWWDDMVAQTGRIMVRYRLDHTVDPHPWCEDAEELRDRAQGIAEAAGIDPTLNARALDSLVVESSYGGDLCVLHYSDLADVLSVLDGGTVTFTDPHLLVYDGLNGSGHDESVAGTVTLKVDADSLRLDAGRYSWSDDIAGVVHSAYETDAAFATEA